MGGYKCNLRKGHFDKLKLAAHASEEGNRCDWTSASVLEFFLIPYTVSIKRQHMCFVLTT